MDRAWLEALLEEGLSLAQIAARLDKHPSTVGYWVRKHGLRAAHSDKFAPQGGFDRTELKALVERGLTVRQIAEIRRVSYSTVRHWLARHDLETEATAHRHARRAGLLAQTTVRRCRSHGETEFLLEGRGYYRCKRCRAEQVSKRRRRVKEILVAEAGGGCAICGYDRYRGALAFHHLDPKQKEFALSPRGVTRAISVLRSEAEKCVLLCANCHAEVEGGFASLTQA